MIHAFDGLKDSLVGRFDLGGSSRSIKMKSFKIVNRILKLRKALRDISGNGRFMQNELRT